MDHSYFKDRVSGYHDGELTLEERHVMAEHLQECQECQALMEQLQRLDQLVAEKSELADDDYWEQAAQKIEKRLGTKVDEPEVTDVRSNWKGLWWKAASAVAAIAVLSFIGLNRSEILKKSTDHAAQVEKSEQPIPPQKTDRAETMEIDTKPTATEMTVDTVSPSEPAPTRAEEKEQTNADQIALTEQVTDQKESSEPPKMEISATAQAPEIAKMSPPPVRGNGQTDQVGAADTGGTVLTVDGVAWADVDPVAAKENEQLSEDSPEVEPDQPLEIKTPAPAADDTRIIEAGEFMASPSVQTIDLAAPPGDEQEHWRLRYRELVESADSDSGQSWKSFGMTALAPLKPGRSKDKVTSRKSVSTNTEKSQLLDHMYIVYRVGYLTDRKAEWKSAVAYLKRLASHDDKQIAEQAGEFGRQLEGRFKD